MIPSAGPADTDSFAERRIYHLLKEGLADDFVVVHSLPWLCSSVREIDSSYPPTGEIDFLIVHESLGILAIEVKGGVHRTEGSTFVHVKTGRSLDPVGQVRRNTHGLAKWLGHNPSLRLRIGYGFIFPDSFFGEKTISPALIDLSTTSPQSILIDKGGMGDLGRHVKRIMRFWQSANSSPPLGASRKAKLLQALCPEFDGTPTWALRVDYDNRTWLRLTPEQSTVVDSATSHNRLVVSGWPGTGKTLIGIELARRLAQGGHQVLGLTLNKLLAKHWRSEIESSGGVVSTWHSFCAAASQKLRADVGRDQEWMDKGCLNDLVEADQKGLVPRFDVLIIDEAQTLKPEWCDWLNHHFEGKRIIVFCDETQLFSFEKERVTVQDLCRSFGTKEPFTLTIPLRSPRIVTDHLLKVRAPSHQLFSPRDAEPDALQERVVVDVTKALDDVLVELQSHGLRRENVVVLSKFFGFRENQGQERYETVSRFRGLESPAVIIVCAEEMDDIELFCAYSRATTVCIALYEAERLGYKAPRGRFQELILSEPSNAVLARETSEQGSTRFIVANHVPSIPLSLQSACISWSTCWAAWLVDPQDDGEAAELWIDFLLCHHHWPVYTWTSRSRREIQLALHVDDADYGHISNSAELRECEECKGIAPFRRNHQTNIWHCQACAARGEERGDPTPELIGQLQEYDLLVCSGNKDNEEELARLPLSLAALGARRSARATGFQCKQLESISAGSIVYRAAMAFVYARISLLDEGTMLILDRVALKTGRYLMPPGVSALLWRNKIAQALGQSYRVKLLTKVGRGHYKIARPAT